MAVALWLGAGCNGSIGGSGATGAGGGAPSGVAGQPAPSGTAGTAGTAAPPVAIPPSPTRLPASHACATQSSGPRALRRLTAAQYDQTLRDLFRDAAVPTAAVFSDPIVLGFTSDADALVVQALGAQQLMDHAELVARWAVTAHLPDLSPCTTMDAACRQRFIREFGKRAFRTPLPDARVQAYDAIFSAEATFANGAEAVVAAMLQSPNFLYRRELGAPDPTRPGTYALTPHELASGLSYLLTGGMPDDALLAAADSGALATPAELDRQAQRLLATPRAQDAAMGFFGPWLQLGRLATTVKDDQVFMLTDSLRQAMAGETRAFVTDTMFVRNGTLGDLLTAPYTFLNRDLAMHYGLWDAANGLSTDFRMVALPAAMRDAGILAHGSILTGHAGPAESSPVQRGKLVRSRLLCQDPPPPPANLDTMLKPPSKTETTRAHIEEHSTNPTCAFCHKLMDPIGFPFEHYDAFGRYRAQDGGMPVDARGTIVGTAQGDVGVDGLAGLTTYLARGTEANQCLVRYWSYAAFGSASWAEDGCTYDAIAGDAARGQFTLKAVLMGIVHAPRFSRRLAP